jgi:hypothetical protein
MLQGAQRAKMITLNPLGTYSACRFLKDDHVERPVVDRVERPVVDRVERPVVDRVERPVVDRVERSVDDHLSSHI